MRKEEREIDKRDEIKIDDYTPENVGGSDGNTIKRKPHKDNTKLIVALFLLVVLILMAVMHIHSGPIIVTGVVLGVLILSLNKNQTNKQ